MEPVIKNFPARLVVGLGAKFMSILSPKRDSHIVIPKLWHDFVNRMGEISSQKGGGGMACVYCPRCPDAEEGECYYLACAEVTEASRVPEGMEAREIPEGLHAVFTHKGKLDKLGETMHAIYGVWLPQSGRRHRNAPDVELYGPKFNAGSEESEFEICVPIE